MYRYDAMFLLLGLVFFTGTSTFYFSMPESNTVYGVRDGIILKDPASFYDRYLVS